MAVNIAETSEYANLDALWDSCLASLVPANGDLTTTAQAWSKATDYLEPRRLEETNTLSNPPEDVVNAVSLLHELGMIQDLLDWHSGKLQSSHLLGTWSKLNKCFTRTNQHSFEDDLTTRSRRISRSGTCSSSPFSQISASMAQTATSTYRWYTKYINCLLEDAFDNIQEDVHESCQCATGG